MRLALRGDRKRSLRPSCSSDCAHSAAHADPKEGGRLDSTAPPPSAGFTQIRLPRRCADEILLKLDLVFADRMLDLPKFACEVGISVSQLSRRLRRHTGHTFLEHVHARRVAQAHHLLSSSTLRVVDVAAMVGYASAVQLRRHFCRVYGYLPVTLRNTTLARTGKMVGRCR